MAGKTEHGGAWADWLTDRVLRTLIKLALALPYKLRVPAFGRLTRHVIGPAAGYNRRSLDNLTMVFPEKTRRDVKRIAAEVSENTGRVLIENYDPITFKRLSKDFNVSGAGLDDLKVAVAANRPVIAVSAHLGNYEAARAALAHRGIVFGGVYRPMQNPWFNRHYVAQVEAVAGPVFPATASGMRGFVKELKRGTPMMLLNDLNVWRGQKLPFLGHPARTALSAAEMALRYDALLLPVYGIRRRDDRLLYDIVVESPIPRSDPETMTRALNADLEAKILQDPAQWFWIHRRWKT